MLRAYSTSQRRKHPDRRRCPSTHRRDVRALPPGDLDARLRVAHEQGTPAIPEPSEVTVSPATARVCLPTAYGVDSEVLRGLDGRNPRGAWGRRCDLPSRL